ncbi:MAG: glycine--tRNA ligase subunit beta [Synergistaceae bacterium]|jgi:glycyl-tRNA synthetase beta chain|nr:glycine--tRNA ligase subunit beta [Synergistaceae bacterium]
MIKRDLLLEIGAEEVPAGSMTRVIGELDRMAKAGLDEMRVRYEEIKTTGTPRRIVLYVKDLADRQDDFEKTVKGPPRTQALDANGEYTASALGFAKSRGVGVSDLMLMEVKGVEYLCAVMREAGRATKDLLPEFLSGLIKKLPFQKNMYWADPSVRFTRPVRWITALWDCETIPVRFGDVTGGGRSRGHRFMGSQSVTVPSASEYEAIMEREFVIVDHERRKRMITAGVAELALEIGGTVDDDPDLFEENAQLVEYPVPFRGSFDESFLDIPDEVLIATMKKNQRYFPVRDASGRLMAHFIGVSNNRARDMNVIVDGNERVLRARLYDAAFFWKEDRSRSLESRLPELKKVLYQARLGSIYDKCERVRAMSRWLVDSLGTDDIRETVDRAALLSKADLVTGMVFEFPEAQGVMGREYASLEGEPDAVCAAIYEQYLPRFAGDRLPAGRAGAIIGICDRVDSIIGIHKIGLPPTGSQDPYGLRRAARCINEILWGLEMDADIGGLFGKGAELLGADDETMRNATEFFRQRLHNQLRERGYGHGATSLAAGAMGLSRPLQALRMLKAFDEASGSEWFASLVTSAIRVGNILNKLPAEELKSIKLDEPSLTAAEERDLKSVLDAQSAVVKKSLSSFEWSGVCLALSKLSPVISNFFDGVMVMDSNPAVRSNRLALLIMCGDLFDSIGDFSLIKQG